MPQRTDLRPLFIGELWRGVRRHLGPVQGRMPLRTEREVITWLFEKLFCPACMGLRFGPLHLILRATGWCDGKGSIL